MGWSVRQGGLAWNHRTWFLVPGAVLLIVVFLIPVLLTVANAFNPTEDAFTRLLSPSFIAITGRTVATAGLVTVLSLVVAYPVAYLASSTTPRAAQLILGVVGISMFVSIVVRGYAWLAILDRRGIINILLGTELDLLHNTFAVVTSMVQYGIPLMVFPLYNAMRRVDPQLVRAAQSLGATPLRSFLGIYIPQTLHGAVAGTTIVFVVVLGYYILPAIVGGPQNTMISEFIATQFLANADFALGSAAALFLLACSLAVYLLIQSVGRILVKGPKR